MKAGLGSGFARFTTGVARAAAWFSPGHAAEPDPARLVNIATRAQVGGAAGTPIAGFVVSGTATKKVLIRAAGAADRSQHWRRVGRNP